MVLTEFERIPRGPIGVDFAFLFLKEPIEEYALSPGKPPSSIGKFAEIAVYIKYLGRDYTPLCYRHSSKTREKP